MVNPFRFLPMRRVAVVLASLACATSAGLAATPVDRAAAGVPAAAAAAAAGALSGVGSTQRLEILPLVDWATTGAPLRGEAGVSYLVRTDRSTILFDVGGNLDGRSPSPLVANMKTLGVRLDTIDTIVISHLHMDHVGGLANARSATFSLDRGPLDLAGKRVVVPTAMSYPGVKPERVSGPQVLAPGVASTGTINGRVFLGSVDEQALAVRVEGKGIVLIVGCGHQGIPALLERATAMFGEPPYGLIGGLHFPIPSGRLHQYGIDLQRWATWGPGSGPGLEGVQRDIARLQAAGLQWVAVSPHDSSDEVIEMFRKAFGSRFHDLRVGQVLAVSGPAD